MIRIGLSILLVLVAVSVITAQTKPREVDLTIDGIGSGSPFSDVVAKFGVPPKKKIEKEAAERSCTARDHTLLTTDYPGLRIVLLGDGFGQAFEVVEMTITAKKWNVSGARIGDSPASIEKRFGKPNSVEGENARMIYRYVTLDNLGNVIFEFSQGKLVKMVMAETLC